MSYCRQGDIGGPITKVLRSDVDLGVYEFNNQDVLGS